MTQVSLNQIIFRLVVGLIIATSLVILVNVWQATHKHADLQLEKDLQIAEGALTEVIANREEQLIGFATLLTADFGFKEATASKDKGTIESALLNHGQRIEADLMAIISFEGQTLASVPGLITSDSTFEYPSLIDQVMVEGGASEFLLFEDRLFQVIMLSVDAPAPIAIALVAFELDLSFLQQLKNVTQLDKSLLVSRNKQEVFFVSTDTSQSIEDAQSSVNNEFSVFTSPFSSAPQITSQTISLAGKGPLQIDLFVTEDLRELYAEFTGLQANIALITVFAILISILLAALLSRRLAKPITRLSRLAKSVEQGQYQFDQTTQSHMREFNQLSSALLSMQHGIQNREKEVRYQAQHDFLTGLYNRFTVGKLIEEKLEKKHVFQAIGINIFGFRGINDVFGYQNGDVCLKVLAERISKLGGLAARLTGGEILWVPEQEISSSKVEAVKQQLEEKIEANGVSITLKVALGILKCPQDADTAEDLFRRMNIVLDEAQITKQLTLCYDEQFEARYLRRLQIITELKKTLRTSLDELSLYYQPKLNLKSGKVDKVEALIRWHSNVLGFVPPDEFIGIAEHAGFIHEVTQWVLDKAATDVAFFAQQNIDVEIAINLSAKDITAKSFLSDLDTLYRKYRLARTVFSFEVTESDLVKDPQKAIEHLQLLRENNVDVAIDDFGTGYSSMAYLKRLPVNILKIDKSFVLNLKDENDDLHIVQTIITLANNFDMKVVAEGVENEESLKILRQSGCHWAQGFIICKPIPRQDFITWYKDHNQQF